MQTPDSRVHLTTISWSVDNFCDLIVFNVDNAASHRYEMEKEVQY